MNKIISTFVSSGKHDNLWAFLHSTLYFITLYYVYAFPMRKWEYLGFPLGEHTIAQVTLCWALSILPIPLISKRIKKLSTFTIWCIYYFVYIPAVLIPVLQNTIPSATALSLTLFASFCSLVLIANLKLSKIKLKTSKNLWHAAFITTFAVTTVYLIYSFRNNISFAAYSEIYSQRRSAGENAQAPFSTYFVFWLMNCFSPILIAIGLIYKKHIYTLLGISGQLVIYSSVATKTSILSILVMIALHMFVTSNKKPSFRGIGTFSIGSLLLPLGLGLIGTNDTSSISGIISSLILMRTFAMTGGLTGVYYDFFASNPMTNYSHINFVQIFTQYPYEESLGRTIGASLGFSKMNANANFFATDGIAAAGLPGVMLIGIIVGVTLLAFDSVIPKQNVKLACIACIPAIINLSNTSFFTTLLSGGLLLVVLFMSTWSTPVSVVLVKPLNTVPKT